MIIYFADRMIDILGSASTNHNSRFVIVDDNKTEDSGTGIGTFEFKVAFNDGNRLELEAMLRAGNCVLRAETQSRDDAESDRYIIDSSHDFFTITETETDVQERTIYAYAEDAGLDLINDLAPAKEYTSAADIETYINDFASNSGFTIRVNEIPGETRKLSWDSESTVSKRLQDIAENFGCDISFAFEVQGLAVTEKYIDITASDGTETDVILYMDKDISNITVKESINNLATALYATGKDKLTLSGYTYDDGDFYVNGKYLFSRQALEKWRRYAWKPGSSGDIYREYSCEAATKLRLCEMAMEQLKIMREPEINYEVDIRKTDVPVSVRDRISVVDDKGELYLSAKVLQLETSVTSGTKKATLGDYIMQEAGISDKVMQLASGFSELSKTRYIWIAYADDETGAGISLDPAGKEYMGTEANQASEEVDISDPSIFKWSKIKGEQGPPGDPGTSGKGIESESKEYYLSTSSEEVVGGTWQSDIPEWQSGRYIWSRNVITWTDGTVSYTDPILENTLNHVSETADYASSQAAEAKNTAQTANEAAASAQNAANEAINKAETAQASAAESQAAVSAAQSEITAINTEVTLLKDDTAAIRSEVSGQIETINETLSADYSKKTEVSTIEANLKAEISKSSAEIKTTLSEDYAAKSELAELQGSLQTQITQNAEGISINASKVEKLETDTAEAQTQITAAQTAAQNAQKSADEAKTAASKAQSDATTANNAAAAADAKAQSAQKAADDAQTDLNNAKANLEEVTNRVDATEDEITAAQAAVDKAQKAADDAQAAADTAKTNAATAQSAASAAQTKADSAAQAAASAQAAADKAQSDLEELTSRVTKAETSITNNAEAIKLAATKEEVATTLAGYSTTTEMNAVIEQKANSITSEVSSTYATKTENQTALSAAQAAQDEVNEISDKTRSGYIETLSGSGFVQSTKTEDGGTAEVVVYGKSIQDGTPTPEAPVEIQSVTNPKVTACGSNLLLDSDSVRENNNYNIAIYSPISPLIAGETYTVTVCATPAEGVARFSLYFSSGTSRVANLFFSGTTKQIVSSTFTMAYSSGRTPEVHIGYANAELYRLPNDGTVTSNSVIHWIKIEKNNTATDYEPYKGNTTTLSDIVLRSTPDGTRDRLFKDTDGLWKVERNINRVIIDGTQTVAVGGTDSLDGGKYIALWYDDLMPDIKNNGGTINQIENKMSDRFEFMEVSNWSKCLVGKWCYNVGGRDRSLIFVVGDTSVTDISSAQTWLAANPVVFDYVLSVPTYETLPDSIQAELNALTTYNPVTNVIASDGVTPDIDVSFWTRDYRTKNTAEIAKTTAEQTANKFTWLVESGTSSSNFTLTDRVASLLSSEFQIDALTTFKNSAMDGTSTVINGGAIKANTISADKLNVTDLSALGATIGGFTIDEYKLSNAENPTSILDIGYTQEELKKWPGAMGDSSYIDYQGNMMVGKDNTGVGFYSLRRRGTPPVTISETRSDYKLDLASGEKTDLVSSKLYAGLSGEAVVFVIGNDEMMESWTETWYSHAGFGSQYVEETGLGLTATDATMQAECNLNVTGDITSKGTAVSLNGHKHSRLYNTADSSYEAQVALILDGDYYYFRGSEASKYVCGSEARPWYKTFTENLEVTKGKPVFTYIGSKGGGSTVSYATNMYVGSTGVVSRTTNTSSKMIKHDIAELKGDAIKAENLYNVNVYQAKYNEDILSSNDPRYSKDLPMFIIEDLDEKYPIAVDKPSENVKEWSWNAQYIIPPMLKLIQEQHKVDIIHEERFNQTELRISALQNQLNEAMITIAKQQKQIDLLKAS